MRQSCSWSLAEWMRDTTGWDGYLPEGESVEMDCTGFDARERVAIQALLLLRFATPKVRFAVIRFFVPSVFRSDRNRV